MAAVVEQIIQDVRYAFRTFVRHPGFAVTAILALALGIGANTAVFSVVYAVLLKPLPFAEPDRLIYAHDTYPAVPLASVSWPKFVALRDGNRTLSSIAAMLFSLSKSFTSTAVGLAIAEGKLTLDDPILRFFPEDAPSEPSASLKAMRIRDLLTMSTGHHDEDIRDFPFASSDSLVKKFLILPVSHKPGTFFVYNTPASYMTRRI